MLKMECNERRIGFYVDVRERVLCKEAKASFEKSKEDEFAVDDDLDFYV